MPLLCCFFLSSNLFLQAHITTNTEAQVLPWCTSWMKTRATEKPHVLNTHYEGPLGSSSCQAQFTFSENSSFHIEHKTMQWHINSNQILSIFSCRYTLRGVLYFYWWPRPPYCSKDTAFKMSVVIVYKQTLISIAHSLAGVN